MRHFYSSLTHDRNLEDKVQEQMTFNMHAELPQLAQLFCSLIDWNKPKKKTKKKNGGSFECRQHPIHTPIV